MKTHPSKNMMLDTDSYKLSHFLQYPPGTERVHSYIEARGASDSSTATVFFGLQAFLNQLSAQIDANDIEEAAWIFDRHGVPWIGKEAWYKLKNEYNGRLPLRIRAAAEGTPVDLSNVLVTIENTDVDYFWLPSYLETAMLRAVWYGTSVATNSYYMKKALLKFHRASSDLPDSVVDFKLHDFGCRGVSSYESAAIGGAAHLINFKGTDTLPALKFIRDNYAGTGVAGFSIPAAEHSTITSWGKTNEAKAYLNMLDKFGGSGKLVAVVSDSYDIYNAVSNIWGGELKERVISDGGTVVIRPDSGKPEQVVINVIDRLMEKFGHTINSKGYKVLPSCVRVIQGDGITRESLSSILAALEMHKLSLDNIAFGMGGGLLQKVDRDTYQFAMKCSAVEVRGPEDGALAEWRDVFKAPIDSRLVSAGSASKVSKKGRLSLWKDEAGKFYTLRSEESIPRNFESAMSTVYMNGPMYNLSFDEVRKNASA